MALKKQLTTSFDVSGTVTDLVVTSFAFDLNANLIHIGYSALDSNGNALQTGIPLTLSGADFTSFITRLNELSPTLGGEGAEVQTCLENLPFVGTIANRKKTLTTPYDVAGTVIGFEVDSFASNTQDRMIHIGYSYLESLSVQLRTDIPHTLSGPEYENFNTRFDTLCAILSGSQAKIQTCLEFLPFDGTIVDV